MGRSSNKPRYPAIHPVRRHVKTRMTDVVQLGNGDQVRTSRDGRIVGDAADFWLTEVYPDGPQLDEQATPAVHPDELPSSGRGRPRGAESRQRTRELLRLLGQGVPLHDAARQAQVKPDRVLRLLGDPQFRTAAVALLEAAA